MSQPAPGIVARVNATVQRTLPPGTLGVGAGLVVSGLTAYGFLAISARALGPVRYAGISTLWALVFLAAPGLFLPVEQEVGRTLTARRTHHLGGRPVILMAGRLAALGSVVVAIAAVAASPVLVPRLFDGDGWLLAAFALSAPAYALYYLTRGSLAGGGRFVLYGGLLTVEGMVRVLLAAVFAVAGVRVAGPYGFLMAIPCFVAVAASVAGMRRSDVVLQSGPPAHIAELTASLGYLLAGSVLAQALINAGPLAVKLLAGSGNSPLPGVFLNGLVIARIPLFFFQAVLASLLPRLAAQVAAGHIAEFRAGFRRLLATLAAITAVATLGYFALGPLAVRILFGSGYELGHLDLGLLAAASGIYMLALAMAQALLALGGHSRVACGWLAGLLTFAVLLPAGGGLLLRVEGALVASSLAATAVMGVLLARRLALRQRSGDATFAAAGPVA